jgi:hypothetical protein
MPDHIRALNLASSLELNPEYLVRNSHTIAVSPHLGTRYSSQGLACLSGATHGPCLAAGLALKRVMTTHGIAFGHFEGLCYIVRGRRRRHHCYTAAGVSCNL